MFRKGWKQGSERKQDRQLWSGAGTAGQAAEEQPVGTQLAFFIPSSLCLPTLVPPNHCDPSSSFGPGPGPKYATIGLMYSLNGPPRHPTVSSYLYRSLSPWGDLGTCLADCGLTPLLRQPRETTGRGGFRGFRSASAPPPLPCFSVLIEVEP